MASKSWDDAVESITETVPGSKKIVSVKAQIFLAADDLSTPKTEVDIKISKALVLSIMDGNPEYTAAFLKFLQRGWRDVVFKTLKLKCCSCKKRASGEPSLYKSSLTSILPAGEGANANFYLFPLCASRECRGFAITLTGAVDRIIHKNLKKTAKQAAQSVGARLAKFEVESVRQCDNCNTMETPDAKLLQCSRCKFANYCSKDCQRAHWTIRHKKVCILVE